jgi:acetyl-CoA acetyltransferase
LLALRATKAALADAGIDKSGVDGVITCKSVQGANADTAFGPLLGINPSYAQTLDYGSCNFSLHLAAQAIATGMASTVLLCYGANARSGRVSFSATPPSLESVAGFLHVAGPAAMALARHMALYGTTEEQFGVIASSSRDWARKNPLALFRDPLSVEDYLSIPYIVEPLRRPDLTMISDGGAALVVTTAERAAADFPHQPVYLYGMAEQSAIRGEHNRDYLIRPFLGDLAKRVWTSTGLSHEDIDLFYVQDPTAVWILQAIEYFGFCPVGEAGPWLAEGHTRPGGDLPLNTNGGQLSEAYMWGWLHLIEAVRQLRGQAGERQVEGAATALYCSTQVHLKAAASVLSTYTQR